MLGCVSIHWDSQLSVINILLSFSLKTRPALGIQFPVEKIVFGTDEEQAFSKCSQNYLSKFSVHLTLKQKCSKKHAEPKHLDSEKMEFRLFLQYLDREVTSLGFAL